MKAAYKQFAYFCLMRFVRQLFDFYLDASIHVALAILSLIYVTGLLFHLSLNEHLTLFIFFATIASYNFIKYGVEAEKYILVSNSYHRYIQFFSFIAAGIAAYHANSLSFRDWTVLAVLAVLVVLYALPVLPQAGNLRKMGVLKILMVGFVWGGTTVILPCMAAGRPLTWDVQVEALQRLILVMILMLPFEVRDMALDDPSLKTIPQRFGVNTTRFIGVVASFVFFGLTWLKEQVYPSEWLGKTMVLLLLFLVMWRTRRRQSRYYASFWVEAVPMLWLGIVWGAQAIYP